jgi:glucuronoarabinoxylan endo-1,4-beta-xylanase
LIAVATFAVACSSGKGGGGTGGGGSTTADVTATVDTTVRHQTMVGFGAALVYYTNYLSQRNVANDDIYTVLFSDLGLDVLRVANWYQNQTETGTSTSTPFSDTDIVTVVQNATTALGHAPKVLMSSWSPPAYLKSTGDTKNGGTLVQTGGAFEYAEFGQWWVNALTQYATRGVTPDYISIQNEPDWTATWESNLLDPIEGSNAGYPQALDAVSSAIAASSLASAPKIWAPETTGIAGNNVQNYLAGIDASEIAGIAYHLYNGGDNDDDPAPTSFDTAMAGVAAAAATAGKPTFMTELSPTAPSMFNTAWMIHEALTAGGVSAYLYWDLIWVAPTSGPPAGLVTVESPFAAFTTPKGYTINDLYYAVKHYSKWIDADWIRVDATSSAAAVKVTAFTSPDGNSLTVVLLNTDAAAHGVQVSPGSFSATGIAAYRTSGTDERTAAVVLSPENVISLPAQSIATVTLTH